MEIGTTSHFDAVLCEIIYKWFNIPNGKILDVFGGEQTKGVVAGVLNYPYTAIEFRKEQVDVNNKACEKYNKVWYFVGDSKDLSEIIPEKDFDLCFTSPPYYDLEVYSKEDASAIGTYEDFLKFYKIVFQQVYDKLNFNRFLVLKVGEIRDKKTGEYRNFISDNIKIMKEIGFKYYNEIIYLQQLGSAPLRVKFDYRKVTKIHQNILVFYKGNLNDIKETFKYAI
jgi:DNA modification methylase